MNSLKRQIGGIMSPNTNQPKDQEEFMEFLQDMVQSGQIAAEQINEQSIPELYKIFGKLKGEGKWKSKKQTGMFQNGGLVKYGSINKVGDKGFQAERYFGSESEKAKINEATNRYEKPKTKLGQKLEDTYQARLKEVLAGNMSNVKLDSDSGTVVFDFNGNSYRLGSISALKGGSETSVKSEDESSSKIDPVVKSKVDSNIPVKEEKPTDKKTENEVPSNKPSQREVLAAVENDLPIRDLGSFTSKKEPKNKISEGTYNPNTSVSDKSLDIKNGSKSSVVNSEDVSIKEVEKEVKNGIEIQPKSNNLKKRETVKDTFKGKNSLVDILLSRKNKSKPELTNNSNETSFNIGYDAKTFLDKNNRLLNDNLKQLISEKRDPSINYLKQLPNIKNKDIQEVNDQKFEGVEGDNYSAGLSTLMSKAMKSYLEENNIPVENLGSMVQFMNRTAVTGDWDSELEAWANSNEEFKGGSEEDKINWLKGQVDKHFLGLGMGVSNLSVNTYRPRNGAIGTLNIYEDFPELKRLMSPKFLAELNEVKNSWTKNVKSKDWEYSKRNIKGIPTSAQNLLDRKIPANLPEDRIADLWKINAEAAVTLNNQAKELVLDKFRNDKKSNFYQLRKDLFESEYNWEKLVKDREAKDLKERRQLIEKEVKENPNINPYLSGYTDYKGISLPKGKQTFFHIVNPDYRPSEFNKPSSNETVNVLYDNLYAKDKGQRINDGGESLEFRDRFPTVESYEKALDKQLNKYVNTITGQPVASPEVLNGLKKVLLISNFADPLSDTYGNPNVTLGGNYVTNLMIPNIGDTSEEGDKAFNNYIDDYLHYGIFNKFALDNGYKAEDLRLPFTRAIYRNVDKLFPVEPIYNLVLNNFEFTRKLMDKAYPGYYQRKPILNYRDDSDDIYKLIRYGKPLEQTLSEFQIKEGRPVKLEPQNLEMLKKYYDFYTSEINRLFKPSSKNRLGGILNRLETPIKKKGGTISSYLPYGTMHRYNHKADDIIKARFGIEVTKKGIPVVHKECDDEGCTYSQTAEIEVGEVIFDKDTLDSIFKYKDNPKKAGELIYKSLLNVQGNTSKHEITNRK